MTLWEETICTLENTKRMLESYRDNHPKASDEYEKGFMAWVGECIIMIKEDIIREKQDEERTKYD